MQTTMMNTKTEKNRIVLGLSGGVDSTAAALLLQEKGFEVIGYYFDVTGQNIQGKKEAEDAANQLGIKLICEDVSDMFEKNVIENFCHEYVNGRTPNPCIVCNPTVKFKKLIETAGKEGAYYIATGHYAGIHYDETKDTYYIKRAENEKKDQSYMLYRLGQWALSRLILPLSEFEDKNRTRALAREKHLLNAEKKDSQEICFIDNDDYADFLQKRGFTGTPGDFVNNEGKVLGKHKGILHYTYGQRKGLGIALGKPAFVTDIDAANNNIVLGDNEDLFSNLVKSKDNFFTCGKAEDFNGMTVYAKVRYSAEPAEAVIRCDGDRIITEFKDKQRAATPGQSIVFYLNDCVIGGGFIDR